MMRSFVSDKFCILTVLLLSSFANATSAATGRSHVAQFRRLSLITFARNGKKDNSK